MSLCSISTCFFRPFLLQQTKRYFSSGFNLLNKQKFSRKISRRVAEKYFERSLNFKMEEEIANLQAAVKEQGDLVRALKAEGAAANDVKAAVAELKTRKKKLDDQILQSTAAESGNVEINRAKLEDLLKQRFFYDSSFSIYGGISGLYDMGPMGCSVKNNLIQLWRNFFILEEKMLEVDCTVITPDHVLKASGHVDRFSDLVVRDVSSGDNYRADHLVHDALKKLLTDSKMDEFHPKIRSLLPKIETFNAEELEEIIKEFGIKSPNGNELSKPEIFNLMFGTSIGPTGQFKGFLRPETAQGIFLNFKRLLEFNQGKLPFAAAQIGSAFRNEISPRSGLLRVREFTMAEIEYFCDPSETAHPKFASIKDVELSLYSACNQMEGKLPEKKTVGEAVKNGLIANENLGYFLARIWIFLRMIGIDSEKVRFRQHMANEMAHYATDCWDAECCTSYGWVECVGCADRSCFDLEAHRKSTGIRLCAERKLSTPRSVDEVQLKPNFAKIKEEFGKQTQAVVAALKNITGDRSNDLAAAMETEGSYKLETADGVVEIKENMVILKKVTKKINVEEITPSVIEPSFGIGRIMYSLFEHNFRCREGDEQRTFLSLPAVIAPYKCSILPLSSKSEFLPFVDKLSAALTRHNVSHRVDAGSGSIGRRYARTDQIAIPFGVTVDFDTLKDETATLRERDSCKQIRAKLEEIPEVIVDLVSLKRTWQEIYESFPHFEVKDTEA